VLVVLAAHTPPVRRAVLHQLLALAADRLDLAVDADALAYNLLEPRVSISGVSIASAPGQTPFFAADVIEVRPSFTVLLGRLAIDRIRIDNARVDVEWRADGSSNLPAAGGAAGGAAGAEPSAIPIGLIEIPRLAVRASDEAAGWSLALPHVAMDVGPVDGSIRIADPGRFQRGSLATEIAQLGGHAVFDGRTVALADFELDTPEAHLTVDGALALLVAEPRVDVRVSGTADLANLGRWRALDASPAGTVDLEGTVTGPLSAPAAKAHVSSGSVSYRTATLSAVALDVAATGARVDVTRFDAAIANGRVSGHGGLELASNELALSASWADVSLSSLFDLAAPDQPLRPGGIASGSATIEGAGFDPPRWTVDARTTVRAVPPVPGRAALPGRTAFHLADGRWDIESHHVIEGAAVEARLGGVVDPGDLAATSVAGTVSLRSPDASGVIGVLGAAIRPGPALERPIERGRVLVDATISGSVGSPRFEVAAEGHELAGHGISDVDIEIAARGTMERIAADVRLRHGADNTLALSGTIWPRVARLEGRASGRLGDPRGLAPDLPLDGTIDVTLEGSGTLRCRRGAREGDDRRRALRRLRSRPRGSHARHRRNPRTDRGDRRGIERSRRR
jgi:hypothetical protein